MPDILVDGPDGSFSAYLAKPPGLGAGDAQPAVLVIQEIFGVNAVMRGICDDLAGEGYVTLCPDLFWRQEPGIQITDKTDAEWERAFELFRGFNQAKGITDLIASLDHLRGIPGCSGKAGTIGYCLGGKLAYLMATRSNADCNVGYYGVGIQAALGEAAAITEPLLLHIAEEDEFTPKEAQAEITESLSRNSNVTIYTYPGVDHAFARVGGAHWDEAAATLANERTSAFLKKHLT
ncbi:dienelactone hydrolase family protein [Rhodospirillaceae bacterium SYSU D60014]|uniref:dienelactone hydrolase family protein n=1 Tax=Virgifigura deserti TaxID=2268457 RepID=UPI000E66AE43